MEPVKINSFPIIGIAVRTTNENQQAAQDIGALWNRFMNEGILDKIPNKIDQTIYAIYTDYESDHTGAYTTILGCKVSSVNEIPEGMTAKEIAQGMYQKFIAKGDLTKNAVVDTWMNIWNADLKRLYTTDFEVYGEKALDPTNGEAGIFIAI